MKLLCDENVAYEYISALENVDGIEVARTVDILGKEAADVRISFHAEENDYVLLTRDEGFFARDIDHGLIYYSQSYDPPTSELVEVVIRIKDQYQDYSTVEASIAEWAN